MRNHPRIAETPIDMTMPIDPDMAALCVSSVMCALASNPTYSTVNVSKKKRARLKREFTRTCERVLRYENADHSDVGKACALRPAHAVDARPVDERPEDEFTALVLGRRGEDSNDEGGRAERVPPHGDVVEVLEEAHTKGVDHTCGLISLARLMQNETPTDLA